MRNHWNRGTRTEFSTASRDPALQLVKGSPDGTLAYTGLPIPAVVPQQLSASNTRYLFLLASAQFNDGQVARLVGMRQYVEIGAPVAPADEGGAIYPIVRPIVSPLWRFADGNISWSLRRYGLRPNANRSTENLSGSSFRMSGTPSLLFETIDRDTGNYTPPNGGRPPGNVIIPDLGNFHDLRFPWDSDHAWDSLDIEIKGPCTIGLFASVQQTTPGTRAVLNFPNPPPGGFDSITKEDAFLLNFPNTVYTRIAGSLIFESVSMLHDYSDEQPWRTPDTTCEGGRQKGGPPEIDPPRKTPPRDPRIPPGGRTSRPLRFGRIKR